MKEHEQAHWHVVDKDTGLSVSKSKNKNRAHNEADRRDATHGSVKHMVESSHDRTPQTMEQIEATLRNRIK